MELIPSVGKRRGSRIVSCLHAFLTCFGLHRSDVNTLLLLYSLSGDPSGQVWMRPGAAGGADVGKWRSAGWQRQRTVLCVQCSEVVIMETKELRRTLPRREGGSK